MAQQHSLCAAKAASLLIHQSNLFRGWPANSGTPHEQSAPFLPRAARMRLAHPTGAAAVRGFYIAHEIGFRVA